MEDLRQYLSNSERTKDPYTASGLAEWVNKTYSTMQAGLYAVFSEDGKSIEAQIPLPVVSYNYARQHARFELLRRRFVIAGWVSAAIDLSAEIGPNPLLKLAAPREAVIIQTLDGEEFVPEFAAFETAEQAVTRFAAHGASFYRTPWEHVTIPAHQIAKIIRRTPSS
jgi:hypothetical protein